MHDLNYCMPDLNYCMPDLNYCGITAELLRNYCGITAELLRNYCGITAELLSNRLNYCMPEKIHRARLIGSDFLPLYSADNQTFFVPCLILEFSASFHDK